MLIPEKFRSFPRQLDFLVNAFLPVFGELLPNDEITQQLCDVFINWIDLESAWEL